jgi:hypothetical protein
MRCGCMNVSEMYMIVSTASRCLARTTCRVRVPMARAGLGSGMVLTLCPLVPTSWEFQYYHSQELSAERYEHLAPQYDEMCALAPAPYGNDPNLDCVVIFALDGCVTKGNGCNGFTAWFALFSFVQSIARSVYAC